MKRILVSVVAAFIALTASAATTITVADYGLTSFTTNDRHFVISTAKGESTTAPAYNGTGKDLRVYAKGTLTIEAASEMTGIELTISAQGLKRLSAENTADCGTLVSQMAADSTSATVTWTGNSKKVVITVGEKATLGKEGAEKAGQLDFTALTIEGGTDAQLAGTMYEKDFKSSIKGWTIKDVIVPSELTDIWQHSTTYGYVGSAFANDSSYAAESWLISPELDLSTATQATVAFNQCFNKGAADNLFADCIVKVTKDGNTWDTLEVKTMPDGTSWTFVLTENIDITKYISDKFQIAFVYKSLSGNAPKWEIDLVKIVGDGEPIIEEETHIANTPETAYTVSEAIALIDAGEGLSDTVYVKGKVDSIGTLSEQHRNVTIRFNDGTKSMLAYNCFGLNRDSIMSQAELDDMVKIGDDIIVVGTLTKYSNIYELNSRCWIYSVNSNTDAKDTVVMYDIDFKASKKDWTIDDKVLPESISYVWQQSSQYGYKASAYVNKINYATESWLLSPVLDLQGQKATMATLNFTHARKFGANEHLSVKITKDGTTWETLTFDNWPTGNDWNFIEAGAVDITKYISDKTQFAFVYTSTTEGAATWEIGTVTLMGNGEPFEIEEVSIANTPETAYTVSEAIALIDAGEGLSDTVYVKGKVDSIGTLSEQHRNVTIRFNDGTKSMLAYNCFGLNRDSIMSQAELDNMVKIGDDIIVVGTLTKYGSLYEFNSRCWLYSVNVYTAIDNATIENEKAEKFFRNGVLYIRRNGVEYTVMGAKAE